jgi:hypothetical protein
LLHMDRVFQLYGLDQVAKSQVVHHLYHACLQYKTLLHKIEFCKYKLYQVANPNLQFKKKLKTWSPSRLIPSGSWKRDGGSGISNICNKFGVKLGLI